MSRCRPGEREIILPYINNYTVPWSIVLLEKSSLSSNQKILRLFLELEIPLPIS
jgi:hypothetical protein